MSLRERCYLAIQADKGLDPEAISDRCKVVLFCERRPKLNEWDDTLHILTPETEFSFPGNTQPTRYGFNKTAGKDMAELIEGLHPMRTGHHNGTEGRARQMTSAEALRVNLRRYFKDARGDGKVTVRRTSKPGKFKLDTGLFHTNVHPGGRTTSSAGCITVKPSVADEFFAVLYRELGKHQQVYPDGWFPVVIVGAT